MKNVENNRLSVTVDPQVITEVKNRIEEINTLLPFLTGLTKNERVTLPKINRSNKVFVEDALDSMRKNGDILPNFISVEEVEKDYALFNELKSLALDVEELSRKVSDTRMLAGSEAFTTSLLAYKMFGVAANSGVAGAEALYTRLKERFNSTAIQTTDTSVENQTDQNDQSTDSTTDGQSSATAS
ncbi:hypothetical protein [Aquimarina sp. MMG016]|uniref:hypothetical protein n=1 Tax=Aquimarina sp. MMG016 TaxID=2822690 RepID=UPI001B3A51AB|nr:hypothetical protein [Aquimarina sp. MMG016]MBQ4819640.1 hypothetical protein [Aquimarina sp. MMG016]